jgi:fatty-acyl-CoA synthase
VRDGWIHSGDIGSFDSDGFLTLSDRKNDMIVTGGLNVYPQEIEDVMYRFEGISECAVVGAAHEYWVETPVAFYVVKELQSVDPRALREFLRDSIPHYKVPRDFVEVTELPKSAYGKILKRLLREEYAREHGEMRAE